MVAIALKMVLAVSAAFWVGKFTGASTEGINSMALQQGGLGLNPDGLDRDGSADGGGLLPGHAGCVHAVYGLQQRWWCPCVAGWSLGRWQQLPAGAWRESGWGAA
jgi:type IV secretion system protein VirB6